MVDNSPGMAPKAAKMYAQLPKLLTALKDPADGTYPDLRVAIIDSDLGTGGAYSSGSCGPNESNGRGVYGDLGNFQMRGASLCGMVGTNPLWIETAKGAPVNYDPSRDLSSVFACLATNTGTLGCGEEHSLQAFEFALVARNLHAGSFAQQNNFLRPSANLGLVFITDEDDCSAATNDAMFGDKPELRGESASLRCATRAHMCNGANLSDSGPGYPTTASYITNLTACAARTDACPNPTDSTGGSGLDTSYPTACSPLKGIHALATELKSLKLNADQKITVAGIFGWPRNGADGKPDLANAKYRIDRVPNPNMADTAHPEVFDAWPVCYDPNHMPAGSGFDADAWGWGAMPGLRLSAFVDEFGANGMKFSICEPDFGDIMTGIGTALATKGRDACVPADFDLGKTCAVTVSRTIAIVDGATVFSTDPAPLPPCAAGATTTDVDCYTVLADAVCAAAEVRVGLLRTDAEIAAGPLSDGSYLQVSCH